jgi:hypothetical protein
MTVFFKFGGIFAGVEGEEAVLFKSESGLPEGRRAWEHRLHVTEFWRLAEHIASHQPEGIKRPAADRPPRPFGAGRHAKDTGAAGPMRRAAAPQPDYAKMKPWELRRRFGERFKRSAKGVAIEKMIEALKAG